METSYPTPPPPISSPALTNVRTWTALCHASALLGVLFHFPGHILGPLIVWLVKRGESPEIDAHGKEALNFQISILIYEAVSLVFCLVLIGFAVALRALGVERGLRHHRRGAGERREVLSLPDDDPLSAITGAPRLTSRAGHDVVRPERQRERLERHRFAVVEDTRRRPRRDRRAA